MTLLLGIDEGTSAVKAVLYDSELRPVAEARREKRLALPTVRLGRAGRHRGADRGGRCRRRASRQSTEAVTACGLDHQGESVLAWDAHTGRPLTPIVTWQDKRSQEVLDRLDAPGKARSTDAAACRSTRTSRRASSHGCSNTTRPFSEPSRAGRSGWGRSTRFCPTGWGPGSPPIRRRRRALSSAQPAWDPALLELFGVPAGVLPAIADTAGELGTLRHESWSQELPLRARCVDQQAALAGRLRPPGLVKATYGTGVFVLAHAGDDDPAGRWPAANGGLGVNDRLEWAIDGGVFTAGNCSLAEP